MTDITLSDGSTTVTLSEAVQYGTIREWEVPTLEIPAQTSLSTRSEEAFSSPKKARIGAYLKSQTDRSNLISFWKNLSEITMSDGSISVDCRINELRFEFDASLSDKQLMVIELEYVEEERSAAYSENQAVSIALGDSYDVVEYGAIGIVGMDTPQSGFQGWFKDENAKGVVARGSQVMVSPHEV